MGKRNNDTYLTPHIRIILKCIINLEENIGENL